MSRLRAVCRETGNSSSLATVAIDLLLSAASVTSWVSSHWPPPVADPLQKAIYSAII